MSAALSHQERVAASFPLGTTEYVVALYHDHIEDGLGLVPEHLRPHAEVLTRRDDESYFGYIERVRDSGNSVAVLVKIADLRDNLLRCHGEFGGEVNPKRAQRYRLALQRLGAA